MVVNNELLDYLTVRAKASPRLSMHYDLRDSAEDESQRMLNAIEPGTEIPIHRHTMTSEDVIVLRGRAMEIFFDESGSEVSRCLLVPGGTEPDSAPAIHVPIGQYHTCRSVESGTVIIEFKNTKYDPLTTEDLLEATL